MYGACHMMHIILEYHRDSKRYVRGIHGNHATCTCGLELFDPLFLDLGPYRDHGDVEAHCNIRAFKERQNYKIPRPGRRLRFRCCSVQGSVLTRMYTKALAQRCPRCGMCGREVGVQLHYCGREWFKGSGGCSRCRG